MNSKQCETPSQVTHTEKGGGEHTQADTNEMTTNYSMNNPPEINMEDRPHTIELILAQKDPPEQVQEPNERLSNLWIHSDTEYLQRLVAPDRQERGSMLTVNLLFEWQNHRQHYMVFNNEYAGDQALKYADSKCVALIANPDEVPFQKALDHFKEITGFNGKKGHFIFFFSPKDLEYTFGKDNVLPLYEEKRGSQKGFLAKKRCIRGEIKFEEITIKIKDLSGWINGSLSKLAEQQGVPLQSKKLMDNYKTDMAKGMEEHPEEFVDYAIGDVEPLPEIFDNKVKNTNEVVEKLTGKKNFFNAETIPMTSGSLVARVFQEFLRVQFGENARLFDLVNWDLCRGFNLRGKNKKRYHELLEKLMEDPELDKEYDEFMRLAKTGIDHPLIASSSVGFYSNQIATDDTAIFNALVQGGRCVNERPTEFMINNPGADIDLSSCYGSTLAKFKYPLGRPNVIHHSTKKKDYLSLGEALKKYKDELVPHLWMMVIQSDGEFKHLVQDFLFSKNTEAKQIRGSKKEEGDDDDDSHIPGEFCLLRKQIVNGIVTEDVLEIIDKVASDREKRELMNLQVLTVAYYPKSQHLSPNEWLEMMSEFLGKDFTVDRDDRPDFWTYIPIGNFINPLLEERKKYKAICFDKSRPQNERDEANAKQENYKLFVNTLYGDLASLYFPIGNTVVANNITAKARIGAWMMSKALHTRQSITDGGFYSLSKVPCLDNPRKLPSLTTLATQENWYNPKEGRKFKSLGNQDWESKINNCTNCKALAKETDDYAIAHIREFWAHYGVKFKFDIEHKHENFFFKAVYLNKAHYAFDLCDQSQQSRKYKIRGSKDYTEDWIRENPLYRIFDELLDHGEISARTWEDLVYDFFELLSPNTVFQSEKIKQGYLSQDLLPGDAKVDDRLFRINNTHCRIDNLEEFLKRKKRSERKKNGLPIKIFERYLVGDTGSIDKLINATNKDHLS